MNAERSDAAVGVRTKTSDRTPNAKFIVLYGVNNLGKTTQAKKLVERLHAESYSAEYIKYPIYDLEPSGPRLNAYLRRENPEHLTPEQAQLLYIENRTAYEPTLKAKLAAGVHIVAEDYTGTGIAWGMGAGVSETLLKEKNAHLLKEELAFLFEGERFTASTESNHAHETNDALLEKVRRAHRQLGRELNWRVVNANRSVDEIHEEIWSAIRQRL